MRLTKAATVSYAARIGSGNVNGRFQRNEDQRFLIYLEWRYARGKIL